MQALDTAMAATLAAPDDSFTDHEHQRILGSAELCALKTALMGAGFRGEELADVMRRAFALAPAGDILDKRCRGKSGAELCRALGGV